MMMMIAPNSRARKGGKKRREVKWEHGRICGEEERNADNSATQSAMCCTMCKRCWAGIGHERFENDGSVLGRHPGRGYTGGRRSPTL